MITIEFIASLITEDPDIIENRYIGLDKEDKFTNDDDVVEFDIVVEAIWNEEEPRTRNYPGDPAHWEWSIINAGTSPSNFDEREHKKRAGRGADVFVFKNIPIRLADMVNRFDEWQVATDSDADGLIPLLTGYFSDFEQLMQVTLSNSKKHKEGAGRGSY